MSDSIPYADIIILALVAGFILLRLRGILGTKSGRDDLDFFRRATPEKTPVVHVEDKSVKSRAAEESDPYLATLTDSSVAEVLGRIRAKDASFSATHFLSGARAAFEMVFDAYVKGDRQTLKMLLSSPIFQHFSQELDKRATQENHSETTLVSVVAKDIAQATLTGSIARIIVHFVSEQVTVVRNANGEIIDGNPSEIHQADDRWTFERDVTSRNPNWAVVET